nr:DUF418 domain-containing protein [Auraticoccus cholistanensis]
MDTPLGYAPSRSRSRPCRGRLRRVGRRWLRAGRVGLVAAAAGGGTPPPRPRVVGVDVARAVALLGMVVAHAAPRGAADGWDSWLLVAASERSRLLFAVTAGLGLGLLTGGAVRRDDRRRLRDRVAARGLLLLVLGSLLTLLDPPVRVILDEYGLAFWLVLPLVFLPTRLLLVLALAGVLVLPGAAAALATVPAVRSLRLEPWGVLVEWAVTGSYPLAVWVPVLLLGVAVTRLDLTRVRRVGRLAAGAAAVAVLGLVAGAQLATPTEVAVGSAARGVPRLAVATSLTVAGNVAVGLACALLLVALTTVVPRLGRLLAPLAAAGAMPLTLYTAQVLLLWALAEVTGRPPGSWALVGLLAAGSVVFAWCWRRLLGRGPLERLAAALGR